jgi:hypothetical protein
LLGKYFQALGALSLANKIARGDGQVVHRVGMLKEKISGVEMREDLKGVMEKTLLGLESTQNGI